MNDLRGDSKDGSVFVPCQEGREGERECHAWQAEAGGRAAAAIRLAFSLVRRLQEADSCLPVIKRYCGRRDVDRGATFLRPPSGSAR